MMLMGALLCTDTGNLSRSRELYVAADGIYLPHMYKATIVFPNTTVR
jgi:hypothetical protein